MGLSQKGPDDGGARECGLQLERVYQEIKQRIVYGRYAPGTVLSETVLARMHRSSRTPVREALSRLLEEGYVDRVPRKGCVVAPLTTDSIQKSFEVRRILEGTAAEKAAATADDPAVARMRELAAYPPLERTPESYYVRLGANDVFHLAVVAATQNGFLVDLVRHGLTQHNRVLSLGLDYPVLESSVREHHAIVDAIEARDPCAARAMMERHLDNAHRLVMDCLVRGRIRGVCR